MLSASECWASSEPNGQGDRHELILNKCANPDDPTMKVYFLYFLKYCLKIYFFNFVNIFFCVINVLFFVSIFEHLLCSVIISNIC